MQKESDYVLALFIPDLFETYVSGTSLGGGTDAGRPSAASFASILSISFLGLMIMESKFLSETGSESTSAMWERSVLSFYRTL